MTYTSYLSSLTGISEEAIISLYNLGRVALRNVTSPEDIGVQVYFNNGYFADIAIDHWYSRTCNTTLWEIAICDSVTGKLAKRVNGRPLEDAVLWRCLESEELEEACAEIANFSPAYQMPRLSAKVSRRRRD